MKIRYQPDANWKSDVKLNDDETDVMVLLGNKWDDYSFKTTLNAVVFIQGEKLDFDFHIKIIIGDESNTSEYLYKLCEDGWDGVFPIPANEYYSVPSDISIYEIMVSTLGHREAYQLFDCLHDAGMRVNLGRISAGHLENKNIFKYSLLRESGAVKSYRDGWSYFRDEVINIDDFDLSLRTHDGKGATISFKFNSELLPYDINVMIGANGVGKSYAIKSLVEYWLKTASGEPDTLRQIGHVPFNIHPNFSNLILISFSPFEDFKLDLTGTHIQETRIYKYFGLRRLDQNKKEVVDKYLPAKEATQSLIKAVGHDFFYKESGKLKKVSLLLDTLKEAIDFDCLAVEVNSEDASLSESEHLIKFEDKIYLNIHEKSGDIYDHELLTKVVNVETGVTYFKGGNVCLLSSGQKMFGYIITNIIGEIRTNSMVVIDEPELYLHPTLEIGLISLLKKVLIPFNSKAILATHSISISREVPGRCVHIFRNEQGFLDVVNPPFETFGGSVQKISAYVFGDRSISKPFQAWLEELIDKHPDAKELIEKLGDEINENLIMSLYQLEKRNGH